MKFDVIIIGGGLAGITAATALQQAGLKCVVVSEGLSLNEAPGKAFRACGGTILPGDRVTGGTFSGDRLLSVNTEKLAPTALEADFFILATGKYFSRGIMADMDKVYEPVFGLDVEYDADRSTWFNPDFSQPQRFLEFGVRTLDGCALRNGRPIVNLFPAGEVLAGLTGSQGDASGRIRRSGLDAAETILKGRKG